MKTSFYEVHFLDINDTMQWSRVFQTKRAAINWCKWLVRGKYAKVAEIRVQSNLIKSFPNLKYNQEVIS